MLTTKLFSYFLFSSLWLVSFNMWSIFTSLKEINPSTKTWKIKMLLADKSLIHIGQFTSQVPNHDVDWFKGLFLYTNLLKKNCGIHLIPFMRHVMHFYLFALFVHVSVFHFLRVCGHLVRIASQLTIYCEIFFSLYMVIFGLRHTC